MRIATPLALAASLLATSAFAQMPSFLTFGGGEPFNGPYIGAQAGWQLDRQDINSNFTDDLSGTSFGSRTRAQNSGFRYGGQIGLDVHVAPRIVVGVEAAGSGTTGANYGYGALGEPLVFSVGQTLEGTGHVGFLVNPRGMLYAKGGFTNAEFHFDDPSRRFITHRNGYIVGGGYEQMIAPHVSAGIEYDYSRFDDHDFSAYAYDIGATNARIADNRHQVVAKVNFRF